MPVRWSCRTGVCHTCETTLIAGDVDYSPDPVEPPADGSALICCSQPRDDWCSTCEPGLLRHSHPATCRHGGIGQRRPAVPLGWRPMRLVLNVIWLVLAGFWLFVAYMIAAILAFVFIITIPFGVAAVRIGVYSLWPFGRTVIPQVDKGAGSTIGNIIWFILGGWWLALAHLVTGILLCLTIIGIPLGIANFKLINVCLRPFGRRIVSLEEAQRLGAQGVIVPAAP